MIETPQRLQAFAVEDTTVQLTWGELGTGAIALEVGDQLVDIVHPDMPGGIVVDGLTADTHYKVHLHHQGRRAGSPVVHFTTLTPPPGNELFRFATVSDLHLGMANFGFFHMMRERPIPEQASSVRCGQAAVDEALSWGAQELLVKGDVTERGSASDWEKAGDLLGDLPVPLHIVPGNHDVYRRRKLEPAEGAARHGLPMTESWDFHDRPGVRLIMINTAIVGHGRGRFPDDHDGIVDAVAEAPAGVVIAMHHHLQTQVAPTFWPPGIPSNVGRPFLDAVAAANPATLITSGHTHRHHQRSHRGVAITEVGSTKDWPGVWAGYAVHEGGIRQMVRRVQRRDCIAWTDYTRLAVNGIWGRWSPGKLDHRCFTTDWSTTKKLAGSDQANDGRTANINPA